MNCRQLQIVHLPQVRVRKSHLQQARSPRHPKMPKRVCPNFEKCCVICKSIVVLLRVKQVRPWTCRSMVCTSLQNWECRTPPACWKRGAKTLIPIGSLLNVCTFPLTWGRTYVSRHVFTFSCLHIARSCVQPAKAHRAMVEWTPP